jgi:hypothetical protein
VLTPRTFSETDGSERWSTRTECLIDPGVTPVLSVRMRCLQTQRRTCEQVTAAHAPGDAGFTPVEHLEVDGVVHLGWDEAVDQSVDLAPFRLVPVAVAVAVAGAGAVAGAVAGAGPAHEESFSFPGGTDTEFVRSADGVVAGRFVRRRETVAGVVRVDVSQPDAASPYRRVAVTVENTTAWSSGGDHRDDAMGHSLIAVHTMLAVDDGRFISLLDPPDDAATAAAACHSEGAYPVLIGDDDVVLSSPIILYDHPEVAPQSPGDLYDSLEIDEILALRVMTLTDEEKAEARGTDPRAAAIIDRCDDMTAETLSLLHGQMRPVGQRPVGEMSTVGPPSPLEAIDEAAAIPWWDPEVDASFDPWTESVWISGVEVAKGSAVRLQPSHRSDAQDIFLAGMAATVAGVFTDVDGEQHVAVTVDDDPATKELVWQGRFLFFHPDEVEPLVGQDQDR